MKKFKLALSKNSAFNHYPQYNAFSNLLETRQIELICNNKALSTFEAMLWLESIKIKKIDPFKLL